MTDLKKGLCPSGFASAGQIWETLLILIYCVVVQLEKIILHTSSCHKPHWMHLSNRKFMKNRSVWLPTRDTGIFNYVKCSAQLPVQQKKHRKTDHVTVTAFNILSQPNLFRVKIVSSFSRCWLIVNSFELRRIASNQTPSNRIYFLFSPCKNVSNQKLHWGPQDSIHFSFEARCYLCYPNPNYVTFSYQNRANCAGAGLRFWDIHKIHVYGKPVLSSAWTWTPSTICYRFSNDAGQPHYNNEILTCDLKSTLHPVQNVRMLFSREVFVHFLNAFITKCRVFSLFAIQIYFLNSNTCLNEICQTFQWDFSIHPCHSDYLPHANRILPNIIRR